jgi:hypothetical protein
MLMRVDSQCARQLRPPLTVSTTPRRMD